VITLTERLTTSDLSRYTYLITYLNLDLETLGQFDHINQMIKLSVITLSGFHCTINFYLNRFYFFVEISKPKLILFFADNEREDLHMTVSTAKQHELLICSGLGEEPSKVLAKCEIQVSKREKGIG